MRPGPAPFGLACAAGLLAGVLVVQRFPALPPGSVAALAALLGLCLWRQAGPWRVGGALLLGLGLACLHAQASLSSQLPESLAGLPLVVEGQVLGLPLQAPDASRFEFQVSRGDGPAAALVGKKLRLGWYQHGDDRIPDVAPGSRWRLAVKLRAPRGLVNPGGFDFERRALEQRIAATGYVLASPAAARMSDGVGLDALRGRLSARIAAAVPGGRARFVSALALGDTRGLSDRDWEVLRVNGLTHLIAISGFHVGLVAGFGALLGQGVYRALPAIGRRWPRPMGCALAALLLAAGYTALAGFALPTVRTLLMIAAVLLARLARREPALPASLAIALIAVLVADPLSVLAPGFWLSFLGVAWLVWCLPDSHGEGVLRPFLKAQGVAMLGLLPLSVWFFSQASLAGPWVNLVGIPWISLGVVPLSLLGLALDGLSAPAAAACWQLAGLMMQWLWLLMDWVAQWPAALVWLPEPSLAAVALALAGTFWLLLPRGVPGKALSALMLLPLLWPALHRPRHGEAELVLLDVGQGLSLLVLTRTHALLYDAGPAVPRGLDLGEAVVLPALRARGVVRLDRLLLSHGDNDHAGGAGAVVRGMPTGDTMTAPGWAASGTLPCAAGQSWQWDGVHFSVLHPTAHFPYQRNDSSCVLRIQAGGASALLAGDIGRHVEARLARLPTEKVHADVLLVPHHGSDTSSSLDFLAAVRPRLALLAVGHGNRFGLPKPAVLARYERYEVAMVDTASSGAIGLRLGQRGFQLQQRMRQDQRRYWRHAGPDRSGYANGGAEPDR
ncbi:MAG: DNA internalization-related competence protein ComEC/Rec2 [Arenimonas sp.]|nr:DNA internalization-related competence protein ComEC/Rec2 [Arenimonas sp.]